MYLRRKSLRCHEAALLFISMQECFQNGEMEKDPDADIENYRHCYFASHRGVCGAGGVFFCAFPDPHFPSAPYHGTVYTCYYERCDGSCASGVSGVCSSADPVIQVYTQSGTVIPVTIIVALWSAGKGVLSVTSGLNCIYAKTETRNYFYLRIRASFYTVLFLLAIMLSLILSVFGNSISVMLYEYVPFLSKVVDFIIRIRTFVTLVVLTVFWDLVYKFLPNRKNRAKTTLRRQLPGAVFTACGWLLVSFIFSVYLDIFTGFTNMYGSLTTIILILLWLYVCMYIILLGGEVNALLERFYIGRRERTETEKTEEKPGEKE